MDLSLNKKRPIFSDLRLAVIGHVEWVTFLLQDDFPSAGIINHAKDNLQKAAGGGAVSAIKMGTLTNRKVDFFTALGNDKQGLECYEMLNKYNLNLYVAWKKEPTRQGVSIVDKNGDRSITIIGKRISPTIRDNLPWDNLKNYDGIFITATDSNVLKECRKSKVVVATPRLGLKTINDSNIELDALIGSGNDPLERVAKDDICIAPKVTIRTEGSRGGVIIPGGRYEAAKLEGKPIDTYGCGDSFAAGVTAGIASGNKLVDAIKIGSDLGADCASYFGPYR